MILLDSSVLIDLFRKKVKKNSFFNRILGLDQDFAISSVTHYEVGTGNKNSFENYWFELTNSLLVLPFDLTCSEKAIDIYIDLRKKNELIDIADILIGATAVANGLKLATLNVRHFERIVGLELIKNDKIHEH